MLTGTATPSGVVKIPRFKVILIRRSSMVERLAVNQDVTGSSPVAGAIHTSTRTCVPTGFWVFSPPPQRPDPQERIVDLCGRSIDGLRNKDLLAATNDRAMAERVAGIILKQAESLLQCLK